MISTNKHTRRWSQPSQHKQQKTTDRARALPFSKVRRDLLNHEIGTGEQSHLHTISRWGSQDSLTSRRRGVSVFHGRDYKVFPRLTFLNSERNIKTKKTLHWVKFWISLGIHFKHKSYKSESFQRWFFLFLIEFANALLERVCHI